MERECAELLPSVCAVLADSKESVPDDTCLEKLLDWFRELTGKVPGLSLLQQNPCLTDLISSVQKLSDPEPSVLSFISRLAGLLAASEDAFYCLEQSILTELFGNRELMEMDATVRCGWIHGLLSMLQHWPAMKFILKHELIEVILKLQRDSSLFVASAANQLLAHILTFPKHQEASPGCMYSEWTECVKEIARHVEDSLESGIPQHIQQSLKLVTLALGNCQPVVMEMLWQKVGGPMESLLEKDPTNMAQRLLELLLAASRTPLFNSADSKIVTVMSLMLCSLTPTLAIPLASGILKLENCPESLRIKAQRVVLHPMDCILNATDQQPQNAGLLDEFVCKESIIEDQLSRKASCISLLCLSLSHAGELADVPSVSVELTSGSLFNSVLAVLQLCIGVAVPTTPAYICRYLIGCVRVQRFAVDTLGSLSKQAGSTDFVEQVFNILLEYLINPDTESSVLKKVMQAILQWFSHHSDLPVVWHSLSQDLFPVLKKRLCDVRWEVRDSALEFLTQLTLNFQGKTEFPPILLSSGILKLLLDLLSDSESYVRASAVTALGQTAYITNNNEENLNSESGTSVQEDVASRLVDILAEDTEGFPRRAVVKVFADWLKQRSRLTIQNFEESAASVLKYGSNDLDWEVKIHSLEMAEVYINQTLSKSISACPYAVVQSTNSKNETLTESLQKLFNLKIFEVLLAGLYDCDRPVAQKACTILISLKQVVLEDREALNLKGLTWAPDILSKCFSKHSKMAVCGGTNSSLQAGGDLVEILSILDLEAMLQALERSSDYIENSPHSLLQDILAATETTEDNAIDCY
ncbi:BRCA1-associated ATM activator 1 isoform X2 [Acipenser oxyrinchus oxyrinchus]|uniref:BRCA1-associated ATM activator 1 isoform X2 n=1 Tax=Acipenser oxyrinchus oxyrinchus TaxID=40147 RepID=A0AAD8G153_ACIOX|nr:BRCA1-associated ATM activator 1 isoform X2 [Acipenser oxyrinchus oxyrinchus]